MNPQPSPATRSPDTRGFTLATSTTTTVQEAIRYLAGRFPITHLIGHSEYRAMEGHPYFVERDPAYRNQ